MEMINKVQDMVTSSKAELEATIINIQKQFEEFSQQIIADIEETEKSFEYQIKKHIEDNPSLTEKINKCKLAKEKDVTKLKKETEKELQQSIGKFDKKVADVDEEVQKALEKLSAFYIEAQEKVNKIIEEHKGNPVDIPTILALQVEPMQKKFTVIREEVAKILKTNYEKSQVILKELEINVNDIENKTKKNYSDIVQKFKTCCDKK